MFLANTKSEFTGHIDAPVETEVLREQADIEKSHQMHIEDIEH